MSDTLHYRFARTEDIAEVVRLVAHSFPGATRTPAWWQEQLQSPLYGGGPETLLVGEQDGRIAAACQIHPLRQNVAGEYLNCAGIGTVAISPTHRKRSLGAQLVTVALRAARERGDVVSALYPFRSSFYRKLGYGHAGEVLQYQFAPESLPDSEQRGGVALLESDRAYREAFELYGRWARTQNGQLERGEQLWASLCHGADRALVGWRGAGGELEGYALVLYRTDLPPEERFLDVEEIVWTTTAARRALYGWLSSLGDQWQRIVMRALPSQRLGDWLREQRLPHGAAPGWRLWLPAATLLTGTMFRLLDARAVWPRRHVAPDAALVVNIELEDAQLVENSGDFRLAMEAGRVSVDAEGAAPLTLRLDVATLSRLFIGALTPSAAFAAGLLQADHPQHLPALDVALALSEPWTFDRF